MDERHASAAYFALGYSSPRRGGLTAFWCFDIFALLWTLVNQWIQHTSGFSSMALSSTHVLFCSYQLATPISPHKASNLLMGTTSPNGNSASG
ncbi:hypothetical protein M431DRAFT_384974 [Trichoderma harzianum CBS 226.95]|uniref:Uncharacterized protein n=1 Tax=Trichoderma harzianum CBS 226.95 TaxID=983964 RepID=A0A2T4AI00_TRIHA|nr:hypothetical protein M431DRAFT_384974 [Trichoderma harzianum CBS 226.95]PTB56699.1 hypothetical protein M431DRAFT_384974 [Trichoderma harzianum CBS 226.95]